MPSPKRAPQGGVPFQIDPGQIPEDGTPIVFEQTFAKRLGNGAGTQNPMTEEDYEHSDWQLEYQLPTGQWTGVEVVKGRPYASMLMERDPGKYRAMPLDRNRKPVESMQKVMMIGNPAAVAASKPAPVEVPERRREMDSMNEMPAWMQMMFQREAQERSEARRRAEETERKREAWEREQILKEEARREREERMAEMRAEREAISAKEAAERNNALIMAGMQMMTQMVASNKHTPPPPPEPRDSRMQELLLSHLLTERSRPSGGNLQDSLNLLVQLDQVAQARADRLPPPEKEEAEEDIGKTMIKSLPMLLSTFGGGGGGGGGGGQAPAINPEALLAHALEDPQIIAKIAARNPEAVARTFSKVVKSDRRIEEAVIKVLSEDDDEGSAGDG